MELSFKSNKLEAQLTKPKLLLKTYGKLARKVNQRIEELKAVESLEVLKSIPGTRCHELSGNRKGELAVTVSGNYRIIFKPDHDPIPTKEDGGLNWSDITAITVLQVEDYH